MAVSKPDNSKLNFSFAGCGFLGMYHFGVVACLKRYVPHLLTKISGASAGALASTLTVVDVPVCDAASMWIHTCVTTRDKVIGALSPSSDVAGIVRYHLERNIPEDAHLLANGKVHISLTRVRDMKNVVVSHFESRADLIEALICAVTIPFFVGLIPPLFRGERYIDGGFSNNLIIHDENTITVSPFCGQSDICPRDGPNLSPWVMDFKNTSIELSTKNIIRLSHSFIPPGPDTLSDICQQGYEDALRFLVGRDLVGCKACLLSSADRALIQTGSEEDETSEPEADQHQQKRQDQQQRNCLECETVREFSEVNLPESVQKMFREAIDDDMKTLRAKLRQYKIMKLFSVATMPLVLSYDFMYATGRKLFQVPEFLSPNLAISKLMNSHVAAALQEALIPLT